MHIFEEHRDVLGIDELPIASLETAIRSIEFLQRTHQKPDSDIPVAFGTIHHHPPFHADQIPDHLLFHGKGGILESEIEPHELVAELGVINDRIISPNDLLLFKASDTVRYRVPLHAELLGYFVHALPGIPIKSAEGVF